MADDCWQVKTPILNPPNNPPGWYFLFVRRDGELGCAGPYPTQAACQKILDTAEPCYASECQAFSYGEDTELGQLGKAAGGAVLCMDCTRDFIAWHVKEYGHPPRPVGTQ